jgi:putative transcriptional regulator
MKNAVRELRTGRGLSQGQLGEALRVSRQTINAIETERSTPSLPLAIELARFLPYQRDGLSPRAREERRHA